MLRRIKLIAAGTIVVCLMGGCKQNKTDQKPVKNPVPTYNLEELNKMLNEVEEEYINYIDIRKITDSIQIDKKKVAFPMSLADFGKKAEFGDLDTTEGTSGYRYRTTISDGKKGIGIVSFYSKNGTENAQIYSFEVPASSGLKLEVSGITFGASLDSVIAALGEPSQKNGSLDEVYRIYYENSSDEYLAFVFQNKKVDTIIFCNRPKELE